MKALLFVALATLALPTDLRWASRPPGPWNRRPSKGPRAYANSNPLERLAEPVAGRHRPTRP
jgi:hypothetical protein